MTPFDPMAILDELQRVVSGYDVSRVNLLAGSDQHLEIAESGASLIQPTELIVPAHDDLFSSGTLGRYSKTLNSVYENKSAETEVAAD
jgi:NADH-quinone oxidoreductase subunit G